jgi:hypothetical protein
MNQIKKVIYGKDIIEPLVCKTMNLIQLTASREGQDAIDTNGKTYEIKYVSGRNRPSFTRQAVNPNKSLHENITERLHSDFYCIVSNLAHYEKFIQDLKHIKTIVLDNTTGDTLVIATVNKTEFRKWVVGRLELDINSKTRKTQFRINKFGRSKHQDAKLREFFNK